MRFSTSLLTDRMPRRTRHVPARVPAGNPYRRVTEPGTAIDGALRLDDAERMMSGRPQPTFTAVSPHPTRPIPALREQPRPDAQPLEVITREGMRGNWRAGTFIADKRSLPAFNAATRIAGWAGLHMPSRPVLHQRWTVERWHAQALSVIASAADAAMAEVDERISAARAQVAAGTRPVPVMPVPARRDGWLREALAEATWGAYRWYTGRDEGKALIYESLHDAVVSSAGDASALEAARASIAGGIADADDLTGPAGPLAAVIKSAPAAGGAR